MTSSRPRMLVPLFSRFSTSSAAYIVKSSPRAIATKNDVVIIRQITEQHRFFGIHDEKTYQDFRRTVSCESFVSPRKKFRI